MDERDRAALEGMLLSLLSQASLANRYGDEYRTDYLRVWTRLGDIGTSFSDACYKMACNLLDQLKLSWPDLRALVEDHYSELEDPDTNLEILFEHYPEAEWR